MRSYKNFEGGRIMTVGSTVKQAVASLKNAKESFEQFALESNNEQTKQLYVQAAEQTMAILQTLEPNVQQIEREDAENKSF